MKRPATWKVLTLGAALTGLGFLGTGAAMADDTATSPDVSTETTFAPSSDGDGDASLEGSRWLGGWRG